MHLCGYGLFIITALHTARCLWGHPHTLGTALACRKTDVYSTQLYACGVVDTTWVHPRCQLPSPKGARSSLCATARQPGGSFPLCMPYSTVDALTLALSYANASNLS